MNDHQSIIKLFMDIFLVENNKYSQPLYVFFDKISDDLRLKIYSKFQSFAELGEIYHSNSLKSLNSKIWKYKGTIYKLRVDHGNESARILFAKTKEGDLTLIHAFLKSTRKTPKKDAHQAISIYETLSDFKATIWNEK